MNRLQGFATILILVGIGLLSGCGSQQPLPPGEQAHDLFGEGQFDEAIRTIDQLLANPDQLDINQHTELLTLKGRCYWEQSDEAYRQKNLEQQTALLGQAYEILSESIAVKDSAEARHVRSLVLEQMGRENEALDDQLTWRRLDTQFGRAYLNEPPETTYIDLLIKRDTDETDQPTADNHPPRTGSRQADTTNQTSDTSEEATANTWQPTARRTAADGTKEEVPPDSSDPRQRRGQLQTSGNVAQSDAENSTDEEEANDPSTEQENPPPLTPPRQRAPGTQFVSPFANPQADFNFATGDNYLNPAPTGVTGRSLGYRNLGQSQPTTGITFQRGPQTPTPFSVPATGIGAATTQDSVATATGIGGVELPLETSAPGFSFPAPNAEVRTPNATRKEGLDTTAQLPSGIMVELHPLLQNQQSSGTNIGQGLSFTGALPQDKRPTGTMIQPGQQNTLLTPNQVDFSRGPYYNPLHPNPKLNPNLLRPDPTR